MVKPILIAPSKKLNQISTRIKSPGKSVDNLFRDLRDTLLLQKDPEGVGLAAPQIGVNQQVFVLKLDNSREVEIIVNPKIVNLSSRTNLDVLQKKDDFLEGCLSLPGVYSFIERPWEIEAEYLDQNFRKVRKKMEGEAAIAFQHELDHLEGILFTQRALEQGQDIITR